MFGRVELGNVEEIVIEPRRYGERSFALAISIRMPEEGGRDVWQRSVLEVVLVGNEVPRVVWKPMNDLWTKAKATMEQLAEARRTDDAEV